MPRTAVKLDRDSDQSAFHNTIRENPLDPTPRLVYSDWLEERGKAEHAQAIRDDLTNGHDWPSDGLLKEAGVAPFDHVVLAHMAAQEGFGKGLLSKLNKQGMLHHADIEYLAPRHSRWAQDMPEQFQDAIDRAIHEPELYDHFSEDQLFNSAYRVYHDGSALRAGDQMSETFSPEEMASWHRERREPIDPATYPASRAAHRAIQERV
jgi:uncharacterized protein (TIGR02996 family)